MLKANTLTELLFKLRSKLHGQKNHIIISSFPKSGSSYLLDSLHQLLHTHTHRPLVYSYSLNEQDLYLPKITDALNRDILIRHHFKANEPNLEILKKIHAKPTVLLRNIFDVVPSLKDHVTELGLKAPVDFTPNFNNLDETTQYDYLIDIIVPWYFVYYESWMVAAQSQEVLFLTYEELIANPEATFQKVYDFYEIKTPLEMSKLNSRPQKTKFNKGVAGRGKQLLSEAQIAKIKSYTRYYDLDFSFIGL